MEPIRAEKQQGVDRLGLGGWADGRTGGWALRRWGYKARRDRTELVMVTKIIYKILI